MKNYELPDPSEVNPEMKREARKERASLKKKRTRDSRRKDRESLREQLKNYK